MLSKQLLQLLRGYKRRYALAGVAAFLAVFFYLQRPILLKIIVDSVLDGGALSAGRTYTWLVNHFGGAAGLRQSLWICGIGLFLVIALYGLFIFVRDRLAAVAAEGMARDLKDRLYDHIQRMPYDWHVNAKAGDLIQRCTSDVETVRKFLASQMIVIARITITVAISLTVMFQTHVGLTLVGLASLPLIFAGSLVFHALIKKNFKISDEMEGELSTVIQESLTGVRVVRAFGRQQFEMEKFTAKNQKLAKLNRRLIQMLVYHWSLSDVVCFAQLGTVLIVGAWMVGSGTLTLGGLILFNAYEAGMLWPLRQLGRVLSDMGKMQISLGRLYEILDAPEEEHPVGDVTGVSLKGDIVVKNLTFAYNEGQNALEDVSFTIKQGQTAAILGTTGSGKSTLMHLLPRLYDYAQGSVAIGGVELRTIDKTWLRTHIGLVAQEPFLYSKSIRENLRMASHDAAEEAIAEAAETACAHAFITGFEKGYDTMVGERGVTLSGGQKQRTVIARTLLRDSDILIFDDSLSAVDSETDARIRAALDERQKDVTTFLISQRVTTLMRADIILVFEDGKLTDQGTHEELISRDGLYARIWKIQNMMEDEFDEAM